MEWLGPALATVGVTGAFVLFRVLSRSRTRDVRARYDAATLEREWSRFARIESLIGLVVVLGVGGGGTVLLGKLLHAGVERMHAARPGVVHHLAFAWYYWAIVAAPFVILLLVAGGVGVYKLILRDRFEEYRAFGILRYGFDTLKVATVMVGLLLPFGAAALVLGGDAYAAATEEGVVVDDYFGFEERRYGYDEVKAIRRSVIEKKKGPQRLYAIEFTDGTVWKSERMTVEPGTAPPPFVAYVAERAQVEIEKAE